MMQRDFEASVQYNDWVGTCAADDSDIKDIWQFLKNGKHIAVDEFLIGIKVYMEPMGMEPIRQELDTFSLTAVVISAANRDEAEAYMRNPPFRAREIDGIELSAYEFLKLFKRFDICLTARGLERELSKGYLTDS
jgi:hypothetical protein